MDDSATVDTLKARIAELEAKLVRANRTTLTGSLLLDYATVHTAPRFFALLALVLRASGLKIVSVGLPGDDKRIANDGLPFNDFHIIPASGNEGRTANESRIAKFNWAMQLLKEGPVIWADLDLGSWGKELPRVDNILGLTILNWSAVIQSGDVKPEGVVRA